MRIWVASLIFYGFVFAVCEILRFLITAIFPPKLLRTQLLLEFVGTLQICTPMFDVGTVMDNYGLWGVFVEITAIEIANCCLMRDALSNPCPLVTTCYRRGKALRRAIYVFLVQLVAAYSSFHLARFFWSFEVHPKHVELLEDNSCTSDLAVALSVGCLVEGVATFVGKWFEKWSVEQFGETWTGSVAAATFSGFICALGITYTGMYANPIVAWACTFNCEGVSHIGHLVVYWLSPLVGWYLAELSFGHEEIECDEEPASVAEEKKKE